MSDGGLPMPVSWCRRAHTGRSRGLDANSRGRLSPRRPGASSEEPALEPRTGDRPRLRRPSRHRTERPVGRSPTLTPVREGPGDTAAVRQAARLAQAGRGRAARADEHEDRCCRNERDDERDTAGNVDGQRAEPHEEEDDCPGERLNSWSMLGMRRCIAGAILHAGLGVLGRSVALGHQQFDLARERLHVLARSEIGASRSLICAKNSPSRWRFRPLDPLTVRCVEPAS